MTVQSIPFSFFLRLTLFLVAFPGMSLAMTVEERPELREVFAAENTTGAFALYDPSQDALVLVNAERAKRRAIPASTFKIANSLIALETGVVADENEIIPYGGKPQLLKVWERDMPMREAIRVSNVPVYQELARRIGIAAYEKWLTCLGYGNGDVGEEVDSFWLKGPLKISPAEQVLFLARLAQGRLPASEAGQETVRNILRLETRNGRTLYGKTGWTIAPTPDLGWFVGWVENERGLFAFALTMDIRSKSDAQKRRRIAETFLNRLDIY